MDNAFGKMVRSIMAIAVVAALAAGCVANAADKPKTVSIWTGSWWAPQVPIAKELWAKDHPDIELDIQPLPINGYLDKFITTALGGAVPDLVELDTSWVSTVANHNLLQPLDDIVGKLPVADISPAAWKASGYKGVQYAIPFRSGPGIYYYNKTVFDKAGVPYPTDDWNYDDFLEVVKNLTIPGEQYGLGMAADISDPSNVIVTFAPMLWAMGGDFLSEDGETPLINSPESVKAITYWSDLYTKYKVTPEGTPNFTVTRDVQPLFLVNKIGLLTSSSSSFDEFSKHKDLKWGTVLSPQRINRCGGWTMGVPEGAKNPEGARIFLQWLSQPEIMAKVMNRFPANRKALSLPPWNDPAKEIFARAEEGGRPTPSVAGWFQMQEAIIVELQKILVGEMTPQQAADAAAAKLKQIVLDTK